MGSEVSTIQSLKAVDAWIDVINANINGGVRTAFKSSRLKFGGSNVNIGRAGSANSLPLQIPETGLMTANTVIDFSQGAITASTENTHLAVQGTGFFVLVDPTSATTLSTGIVTLGANSSVYLSRDGEFRTNQNGFLVSSNGYYVVTATVAGANPPTLAAANMRLIYNNMDQTTAAGATGAQAVRLTDFVANTYSSVSASGGASTIAAGARSIVQVTLGIQNLQYSQFGSTVFDFGYPAGNAAMSIAVATTADGTVLNKSLEASNASMTQSVPELSLAQKLFSALTKVLQITQTNTDAVLNLVR